MQVRVVTMRYQEGLQGFPEDALRAATFGKTVLDVRESAFGRHAPGAARVLRVQGPVTTGCAPPGRGALPRDASTRPGFLV